MASDDHYIITRTTARSVAATRMELNRLRRTLDLTHDQMNTPENWSSAPGNWSTPARQKYQQNKRSRRQRSAT
jgi:hypothetical protein